MSRMAIGNIFVCGLIIAQLTLVAVLEIISGGQGAVDTFMPPLGILTANQLFSVLLPSLIALFFLTRGKRTIAEVLSIRPLSGKNLTQIVLMSLLIQPLIGVLSLLSQFVFQNNIGQVVADSMTSELPYLAMIVVFALFPSVFEEIAMRGVLLGAYNGEIDEKRVIILNGLFFGMIHLDGQQFTYAIVLGAFFAYLVLRTGSIFAGMIAHFTINGTQVTLAYMLLRSFDAQQLTDNAQASAEAYLSSAELRAASISLLFSLILAAVFVWISYKLFFKLLYDFDKRNPAPAAKKPALFGLPSFAAISVDTEAAMPTTYEVSELKHALGLRGRKNLTFFVSLAAVTAIYLSFMFLVGYGVIQLFFLIGCLAAVFSLLFFLRVGR